MDTALASPVPPFISPAGFIATVGRADAPLVIDVRRRVRFDESEWRLPGSVYCAPDEVAALAASRPASVAIVYCVHGHETSRDAARALRAAGWEARVLQGGIDGPEPGVDSDADVAQWRAAPPPRIRKRADLGATGERPSRWITRARPKIDRIACPWLITRFIDPRAEFLYVPDDRVLAEARRQVATAYDIHDAPITHEGERCSFDALLRAFSLRLPALDALATIVRGADTDRLALAPEAAGLLAVSLGCSRLEPDDHRMLAAMLPVYDALYAWCSGGCGEAHGWPVRQVSP